MSDCNLEKKNWLKKLTVLVPLVAVGLVAPFSSCSKKGLDGSLFTEERPLYRSQNSGLYDDLLEMDKRTAEKYRDTGSRAFEKEAERRYKKGRRSSEVGFGRPGLDKKEYKRKIGSAEG